MRTREKWSKLDNRPSCTNFSGTSLKYCGVTTPFRGIRVHTRSVMGIPGSETALEEMMCRVLGDFIEEGFVDKLAVVLFFTTMGCGKGLFCHETRCKRTKGKRQRLNFVSVPFGEGWATVRTRRKWSKLVNRHLVETSQGLQVFCVMNDECVEVAFDKIDEDADRGQINIFVATFTTCWARLRLYHHLETVNLKSLYFDTDSVVINGGPDNSRSYLGNFLGDMTDELDPGDGMHDHIVEFVSCGPKNCGYGTKREKTEVKGARAHPQRTGERDASLSKQETLSPSRGVRPPERTADNDGAECHVHPQESGHQGTHDHLSEQDAWLGL